MIINVAVDVPTSVGAYTTPIVQLEFAARVAPHVPPETENCPGLIPLVSIFPLKLIGAGARFVTVTVLSFVVPRFVAP